MLLQIEGIGNQKLKYKDSETIEFQSLKNYLNMAKKAISKFANKVYNGLATKMLKDEDAVSMVATSMMMADWRWDENYENKQGTKKTKYSYRNQCAIWAIQGYATKSSRKFKNKKPVYSLNHDLDKDDQLDAYHSIKDNNIEDPSDKVIKDEHNTILADLIFKLTDCLDDRQKEYINLYYFEGETFEKIGKKYGITREAVRQGLNKAIKNIQEAYLMKATS
jgi:RNA polymerase sigma factor (sigma-70 family)